MESYSLGSEEFAPQDGQFVQNVRQGAIIESVSSAVGLVGTAGVKDAAGSTLIIDLPKSPILDQSGGEIGSFWGLPKNRQYGKNIQGMTKTDGSAALVIYDASIDLEKLFEGNTLARYVVKITDVNGLTMYGWIGGVSVSSGVYTLAIFNGVALGTQNWAQAAASSVSVAFRAAGAKAEIFRYTSSITLSSASTLAEEVSINSGQTGTKGLTEYGILSSLADGQYAVDYKKGRVYARKLDAADTLTFTYKTYASVINVGSSINGPSTAPVIDSYTQASFNLTAAANQVLVASAPAKQIWVYAIGFTVNVAGTVSFQDQDDLAITGIMSFGNNGGMAIGASGNFAMPIWKLATDKDLEVDVVTSELDGFVTYAIVSV